MYWFGTPFSARLNFPVFCADEVSGEAEISSAVNTANRKVSENFFILLLRFEVGSSGVGRGQEPLLVADQQL